MVDIAVRVPAGTGAVLRSVIADSPSVTVYSNAGLSTPVTLPYTLPTSGSVTLYLGEVGRFRATVTDTAGGKVLGVTDGNANGATPLVFTIYAGADAPSAAGADGSGTYARVVALPVASGGDDTAALQVVIDSAVAGQVVRGVPGESYSISALTIDGVRLDITGCNFTQIPATTGDMITLIGANSAVVGGHLDGNAANQSAPNKGIMIVADDCLVDGVTVTNTLHTGINSQDVNRTNVRGCKVTDTLYVAILLEAKTLDCSDASVIDCYVDRSGISAASVSEGGIKIHGTSSFSMFRGSVSGCTVVMPVSPAAAAAICIETQYVPRGVLRGNHTSGGNMGVSVSASPWSAVTGNVCYNAKTYGVEVAGAKFATVSANIVTGNELTSIGVILDASGLIYSDDTAVTGNTITGCTGTGIRTQNAVRLSITGNTVLGSASYSLNITQATDSVISGNTVDGQSTATKACMLDTCTRMTVTGNLFRNHTQNGVLVYAATVFACDEVAVVGNVFSNCNSAFSTQLSGGATIGSNVKVQGNIGQADSLDFLNLVIFRTSTGSPEGVITAGVGSVFLRRNGGAGTTLYVKESGSGNTGWIAK